MAARRTRLPPEERRAQLVALGMELLADRTLDELSIEALADAAGVSRGLLFHYFTNKADFHLQVVRAAADDLIARTEPDPQWPTEEALARTLDAYVGYVEHNRRAYRSLVRGAGGGDEALLAVFDDTRRRLAERTVGAMAALGVTLDATHLLAVRGWIAYVEDVTVNWLAAGAPPSRAELLDLLARGLPALVFGTSELPELPEPYGVPRA